MQRWLFAVGLIEAFGEASAGNVHGRAGTVHRIGSVMPIKKTRFGGNCLDIAILKRSFFRRRKSASGDRWGIVEISPTEFFSKQPVEKL